MIPFLGKLKFISYKKFCFAFESDIMSGGISLGTFAFVSSYNARRPLIVRHEQEGHTTDSKIWGPLYLLVIGLPSLLWAIFGDSRKCYYDFYTERWANNHAGLKAIKAAIYPENTDYLYFVADGNGRHYFAKDYQTHLENTKKAGL